jgi:hypothetical protein
MGDKQNQPFQLSFNASLKINFQGSRTRRQSGRPGKIGGDHEPALKHIRFSILSRRFPVLSKELRKNSDRSKSIVNRLG